MTMFSKEFDQWCNDNQIRVDEIVPLVGLGAGGVPSDQMERFCELQTRESFDQAFGEGEWDVALDMSQDEDDDLSFEDLVEYAATRGLYGAIVTVSRPVHLVHKDERTTYSWGLTKSHTLYVDGLSMANVAIEGWIKRQIAAEREKAGFLPAGSEAGDE